MTWHLVNLHNKHNFQNFSYFVNCPLTHNRHSYDAKKKVNPESLIKCPKKRGVIWSELRSDYDFQKYLKSDKYENLH